MDIVRRWRVYSHSNSSVAQEESRSISENTKWGMRRKMSKGIGCVPFSNFWGYDRGGVDGGYLINEKQAEIVKRIYNDFLNRIHIKGYYTAIGATDIKTVKGKDKGYIHNFIYSSR